jgi:hypothetical protein
VTDLDGLTVMVEQVAGADGDRYDQLVAAHDALRDALARTDGDTQAAGR